MVSEPGTRIKKICGWGSDESGIAAAEFALVFPLLMAMMIGVFDVGTAIVTNQKSIAAAQIIADLVAREPTVDTATLDDAYQAGLRAIEPYPTDAFGVSISGVEFDNDDNPQLLWEQSYNMAGASNATNRAATLGTSGDGVVVVVVRYSYTPVFGNTVIEDIEMEEAAFARGRRTSVVSRTD